MLGFSPPRRAPRPVRIERERECGIWWHEWFSFIPPAILPHPPIRAAQRGGSHTEQTERSRGEAAAKGSRDTHLASCDWAQLIIVSRPATTTATHSMPSSVIAAGGACQCLEVVIKLLYWKCCARKREAVPRGDEKGARHDDNDDYVSEL